MRVVGSHGVNDLIERREPVGGTVGHEGPDPPGAGLLHVGHDVDQNHSPGDARRELSRQQDGRQAAKWSAAEVVVEGIAYTLEQLPKEPYLGLLIAPGRVSVFSRDVTSESALTLGRAMIERFPVDWSAEGFDGNELDELDEQMLRMTLSFVVDPGTPPRTGPALRRYLTRWLAPPITVHHAESEEPSSF